MTISKDETIIIQVAAKEATQLANGTGGTLEELLTNWTIAFEYVSHELLGRCGYNGTSAPAATPMYANVDQAVAAVATVMPGVTEVPAEQSGWQVEIVGAQHGPLPSWLIASCERAGVRRVFDNRDTATGTNKPWFRQALPKGSADKPAAFWPPKAA